MITGDLQHSHSTQPTELEPLILVDSINIAFQNLLYFHGHCSLHKYQIVMSSKKKPFS